MGSGDGPRGEFGGLSGSSISSGASSLIVIGGTVQGIEEEPGEVTIGRVPLGVDATTDKGTGEGAETGVMEEGAEAEEQDGGVTHVGPPGMKGC